MYEATWSPRFSSFPLVVNSSSLPYHQTKRLMCNMLKLPSYVFLGSGGDKQRCTAGSSFSAGEKANLQIPLGHRKVGKLCFLLTQTALLQSMLTLFFCQKVQGQCKGGILKDRIILGRAGSGWVQKTGWTKLSRLTFLKQAARFDFLKSKVVPMRGTQGMFWTSGSIVYALLCGNLWQPQDVEKQSCIQVNLC